MVDYVPSEKGIYSKRKAFAPLGSKCFSFRIDPFLEGDWCTGNQTGRCAAVGWTKGW